MDTSVAKATTTVGLDFGQVTLENGDRLRLYGTPGQSRFEFMWKILVRDALGLIILLDNSRPDPVADLTTYLDGFSDALSTTPCTVGMSRTESHPTPSLDDIAGVLEARGLVLPIVAVDVRRRDDVIMLIDTLLTQMEAISTGVTA